MAIVTFSARETDKEARQTYSYLGFDDLTKESLDLQGIIKFLLFEFRFIVQLLPAAKIKTIIATQ